MAQFGRALRSGRRGRWFKSSRIDERDDAEGAIPSFFVSQTGCFRGIVKDDSDRTCGAAAYCHLQDDRYSLQATP